MRPETVIKGLFPRWIYSFGAPRQCFSDNGGKFNNEKMKYLADNFGIKHVCAAAESPWRNETMEILNAILDANV